MQRWPMLVLRGSRWYYRRVVPVALRPLIGKREVVKSLNTSDVEQAKLLSLRVGQEVERQLQAIRKRQGALQADLRGPGAPDTLARLHESRLLTADADIRAARIAEDDEELDIELDALKSAVDDHAAALRAHDTSIVSTLLDELLQEHGLHVPPQRRREFALALLKAHFRVLEVSVKRTKAEARGEPAVPPGVTVDGLLDAYLTERKLGSKSEAEIRAAYRRFSSIVGGEFKPASEVTKLDARAYKASLFAAPSNRAGAKDGKLSTKSVKKLMGIVATVYRYGVGQGLVDASPFDGLTRIVRGGDHNAVERRLPYDAADVKAIVGALENLTGAKKFLPLISLYSGCRIEEGAGLRVADVRTVDGVLSFDFVPHTGRGLKTASSQRMVPVHPELLRLGLMGYVASVRAGGLLFTEMKPGPHGKLSGAFSKWWGRYTGELGITSPQKVFHSLRHSFSDALRRAKVEPEIRSQLLGHGAQTMTARYGAGHDMKALQEAVNAVGY
jgi:integrase